MNRSIQNAFLRFSCLVFLYRELIQRNKVSIIFFHNWDINTAETAFKYFSKKYNVIDLNDYIDVLYGKKEKKLPPKSLIITIDDGYKENYNLLPIIKKYNIPVTIFLTAGIVNTKRHFWFDVKHPKFTKNELKKVSNQKRLELLKEVGFEQEKEFNEPVALNMTQINEMKEYVNFQSHTVFHPILPNCSDSEAKYEISESKKILEEKYGLKINSLAFPNGDYSDRDIEIAKKSGYKCCLNIHKGLNDRYTNPFQLKRLAFKEEIENLTEVMVRVSGIRGALTRLKKLLK